MIRLTDTMYIGNSDDAYSFVNAGVDAVLNVAHDLPCRGECVWPDVEYMQVGLIDGPGNEVVGYCSAVTALVTLMRRHEVVAVYDHDGGIALAVAMMYLNLKLGQYRSDPLSWSHWMTWGERLVATKMAYGKMAKADLPNPHPAHVEAFGKLPYGVLEALL